MRCVFECVQYSKRRLNRLVWCPFLFLLFYFIILFYFFFVILYRNWLWYLKNQSKAKQSKANKRRSSNRVSCWVSFNKQLLIDWKRRSILSLFSSFILIVAGCSFGRKHTCYCVRTATIFIIRQQSVPNRNEGDLVDFRFNRNVATVLTRPFLLWFYFILFLFCFSIRVCYCPALNNGNLNLERISAISWRGCIFGHGKH